MRVGDLVLLLTIGVLVGAVPLLLVWSSRGSARVSRLAWTLVFITFDLVVFGGFTRLTDSGLGCPDWPGCFAKANPLSALADIEAATRAAPDGPVTLIKAWIEMIHRFLAMGVGLLVVTMAVLAWRERKLRSPDVSLASVFLVVVQGLFGALTVTEKLRPVIVTCHLLLGIALLGLLTFSALKRDPPEPRAVSSRGLSILAAFALVLLFGQIALGGWVSTNYAVLACPDFPFCRGQWWPDMDFSAGFTLWRELGRKADGSILNYAALTAIHYAHRLGAALVFTVLAALAIVLHARPQLRRLATALALLILAQAASGIATVVLGWPLLAAVLHNAGAAALTVCLVMVNYRLSSHAPAQPGVSRP